MNVIETLTDPKLFQPWFLGPSWNAWQTVLKGAFALPMSTKERRLFRSLADRNPPKKQVRELWIIAGRRAGKDSIASLVAAHTAAFFDPTGLLRPGERAVCLCLACDRDQARIVLGFIRSYFDGIPYLERMVTRSTTNGLELSNGVDIIVGTNTFRAVRGRSIALAIFDEVAFWRDDRSAAPDSETYNAIVPGTITLPGSMLIGISTPHKKSGLLYDRWREHWGKDDGDVLVIRAPSVALNPTLNRRLITAELERDPAKGRAEWLAEWRDDIATFVDRALLEAAVDVGVTVRPRVPNVAYYAFADPSGGASDAFTLAVAHRDKDNTIVLDCLVERSAPFNPDAVAADMAKTLREYGLSTCVGDKYAAQWVVQSFASKGIAYSYSHRDRSMIYSDVLPLFTSGRVRLLDNKKLVAQFAGLERQTTATRDKIDHAPGAHDDLSNAAAGALVLAAADYEQKVVPPIFVSAPRTYVGDHPEISGWSGGSGFAPHLDVYKRDWPVY
jgi:hypothetical protein